ncbi:HAD family hydrolase [Clostridiales bacterium COT073_COT-073]|nr:HAD family hydrolase [Clostridiales bacterium COT073_COT-073]
MSTKKKLAVFDLDGTLLNNHRAISAKNFEALTALNENGYEVVLASGRPEILMRVYYLGMPFIRYVISSNGGIIRDVKADKVIHHCPISPAAVQTIIKICDDKEAECDLYSHGGMSNLPTDKLDKALTDEIVFDFKNIILKDRNMSQYPCEKMFVHEDDQAKLELLRQEICMQVPEVEITQSSFRALDIMAKGVNKGSAVQWLAEYLQVERRQVTAFGDHLNDKEMLEYAGTSVVCSNAVFEVKAVADYVMAESNHESGVAAAVLAYLLPAKKEMKTS